MTKISLVVPGECVPKSRPRISKYGAYTPKKTKDYEQHVRNHVRMYMRQQGLQQLEGALCMRIKIYRKMPKSMTKGNQALALLEQWLPKTKPDLDNYIKAILDASNGVLFYDDSAICELHAKKVYSNNPRVEMTIEQVRG